MAWISILHALWLFLPAYVANMSPVLTARIVPRWKAPIDGGRVHKDGKRLLGDGKTWRGLILGSALAGLTTVAMSYGAAGPFASLDFGAAAPCPTGTALECDREAVTRAAIFLFGALVGLGALAGDAIESYVKRRLGRERGAPWFPFDQLDFVVFGLAAYFAAAPLLPHGWVQDALLSDWAVLATIILATPALHLLVNRIGYWLRLKEVPW